MAASQPFAGNTGDSSIPYSAIPLPTPCSTTDYVDNSTILAATVIDSALQAALREPRERVALLRLEAAVVDFCGRSDAEWMEVGGPYNSVLVGPSVPTRANSAAPQEGRQTSFQKCVVHRLADRFGIVRENGTLLEGSIRLVKRPESATPAKLLQNLEPHEYGETAALFEGDSNITPRSATLSNVHTNKTPKQQLRKMKIMQRSKLNGSRGTTPDKSKRNLRHQNSSSFSEKERAYAEARARIFNDESETQGSVSGGDDMPTTIERSRSSSCERTNYNDYLLTKDANLSASLENKAVYRNRLEEASDPDFQRARHPVMMPPTMYAAPAVLSSQGAAGPPVLSAYYPAPLYSVSSVPPPPVVPTTSSRPPTQPLNKGYSSSSLFASFESSLPSLPPLAANAPIFYPSSVRSASLPHLTSNCSGTETTTTNGHDKSFSDLTTARSKTATNTTATTTSTARQYHSPYAQDNSLAIKSMPSD